MVHPLSLAAVGIAVAILVLFWIRRIPMVMAFAIANFAVFVLHVGTGTNFTIFGSPLTDDLAARVQYIADGDVARWYTFFTATLLHANVLHIVGNMLILLMVGLPFEDRVGRGRFVVFYLVTAFWAVLLHGVWVYYTGAPGDFRIPLVGASGAVFGILAAFATMYPRDQIPMFLIFILLPRVPVYVAATVLMVLEGFLIFGGGVTRVAHAAHLGGAVGGFVLALLLKPRVSPQEAARARPRELDYGTLERLATDARQRELLTKLRENEDEAETQDAWLDRLVRELRCPQCARPLSLRGRGVLGCENGHVERYAR